MCDGVTQGRAGMELSLFSRDVIAMSTAVALSHDMFDGTLLLGICDKIVPGLLIGGLAFGHLPTILVPGGPMTSGLANAEKSRIRQLYAEGKASREDLLEAEAASYHGPGTCTFYGTANSNQMLVEIMGLHLPGASFVDPGTPLREALTAAAAARVTEITATGTSYTPMGRVVDEKVIVNAVVGLLATGGSTNHTMHLVAVAAAAGISLTWEDFGDLSAVVPLLARVYPNGGADVNHFQAAGGMAFLIGQLLDAGLLHPDVQTVAGPGLDRYRQEPFLGPDGSLIWQPGPTRSLDLDVLRPVGDPFTADGRLRVLTGNLGRAVIDLRRGPRPPGRHRPGPRVRRSGAGRRGLPPGASSTVTSSSSSAIRARGPTGCPNCTSPRSSVRVAGSWTPGRAGDRRPHVRRVQQGARGHPRGVTPEAAIGGVLSRVRDGDLVRLDSDTGALPVETVDCLVDRAP